MWKWQKVLIFPVIFAFAQKNFLEVKENCLSRSYFLYFLFGNADVWNFFVFWKDSFHCTSTCVKFRTRAKGKGCMNNEYAPDTKIKRLSMTVKVN